MTRTIEEFAALIDTLTKDLDPNLIKTRPQGGQDISYIEWHTAADLLDKNAPGWQCEIKEVSIIDRETQPLVMVRVGMTIDGVYRENIGSESLLAGVAKHDGGDGGFGDCFSNAYSQAFKRVATLFGVGRSLYKKDEGSPNAITSTNTEKTYPAPPRRGRPAGSKNAASQIATGDFVPAELGPETSGTSAKGPYTYYPVHIDGKEIKHFFNRDYSLDNLLSDIGMTSPPVFPIEVDVRVEKKGNFLNVVAFRARTSTTEVASSIEDDSVPF